MKITYASATMRFDIVVADCLLTLILYRQPDRIRLGARVPYRVTGIKFLSGAVPQITHLFDKDTPTVFVLGNSPSNAHTYVCSNAAQALSGVSRLYHGLVALDKLLVD